MNCWLIALLLLSMTPPPPPSLYILGWASPFPVQIEQVRVTGGALAQVLTSNDGLSGTIAASSSRACVTIAAEGVTTTGAGVRFVRQWDAGCYRVWLPVA